MTQRTATVSVAQPQRPHQSQGMRGSASDAALDEKEVSECARRGERSAFEWLIRRYANDVYGFLTRWTGNPELAADAFQEATIRAYLNIHRLRPDSPFKPWFMRIAINRAKTLLKNFSRRAQEHQLLHVPQSNSQSDAERGHEARDTLERALSLLSPQDRQVLLLRFVEGFSAREMGRLLGVPAPVLAMRLSRARKRFRRVVEELEGDT